MQSPIHASAPGKAMLGGEYAVLDGAPAVVMAINRRAHVSIRQGKSDHHTVTAPGYSERIGRFRIEGSGFRWLENGDEYGLFEAVVGAASIELTQNLGFELDTRAFEDSHGNKLGFGSSAALAAALAMGLSECGDGDEHPLVAAAGGHRQFQGGKGSGADVAASLAGGLIEYRMGEPGWLLLDWPEDLEIRFFYSGVAASTRASIERVAAAAAHPSRVELADAAERLADRWRSGLANLILADTREYVDALARFSDAHGLDVFGAGHDVMRDAADSLGLVYKPSGAGGGDIGFVLGGDTTTMTVFASIAESQGFTSLDVQLDPLGARVSQ